MATSIVKKRLFNPTPKPKAKQLKKRANTAKKPKTRPKQKNPAGLFTLGILNPQRKGKTMAEKKTAKKKKTAKASNPFRPKAKKAVKKKKQSNPNRSSMSSGPISIVKDGAVALGGLVVTRQLPQLVLGTNNAGIRGYGANLLTALIGAFLLQRFAGKSTGTMFGIGGGVYTVSRILTEQLSPVGKYFSLAGMGDAAAAGGMGLIADRETAVPLQYDRAGNLVTPAYVTNAARAVMAQARPSPAAGGMSGGRFGNRFTR